MIYQTVLTRDGHCVMCSCYTCILLNRKSEKNKQTFVIGKIMALFHQKKKRLLFSVGKKG